MKYALILLLALVSLRVGAQYSQADTSRLHIQRITAPINRKAIKTGLVFAGTGFAAGALVSVISTYKQSPDPMDSEKVEKYKQSKKDMQRIASMFYAIGGISLITVCFNF